MLVLSRFVGERVILLDGEGKKLGEVSIERAGTRPRLGFEMLPEIRVLREELYVEEDTCGS